MKRGRSWIGPGGHSSWSQRCPRSILTVTAGAIAAAGLAMVTQTASAASGPTFKGATTNSHIGVAYLASARPAATAAGDVLVAQVTVSQSDGSTITGPAGWRPGCWKANSGGAALVQRVFTRVATSSEPVAYTFSFPPNSGAVVAISAYSGVDPVTRIEGCKGSTAANTRSITAPAVTTTGPGAVITGFAFRGAGTTTPPSGTVERFDAATASDATRSVSASAVDQPATTAGTVGTVTATSSLTASSVVSLRFLLRAPGTVLFSDYFSGTNGLITNEYAYWNPSDPNRVESPVWEMTSGTLRRYEGRAWTGIPDSVDPNATSSNGTHSAVFRLNTKSFAFGNVQVSFRLWNWGLLQTDAEDYDGVHIFLRYRDETRLYYASVNRRDSTVAIKKKTPPGPSNGGTYYTLASGAHTVPYGAMQQIKATVQNNASGTAVTIRLYADNVLLFQATDNGTLGGPAITAPGATGIRGDNANFEFDDFEVTSLG